jgi:O-antigen/teichoic acid export membrane protein
VQIEMTSKKFINQVSLLIILNLLVKLIWVFFIERNVQLKVGFTQFGLYYSIFNFALVLSVIADPGLSNFMVRNMAGKQQQDNQFAYLPLKLILSVIYLIFTLFVAFLLKYDSYQLLLILLGYQILWSFLIYLRSYFKAHQLFYIDAFFSVLDKFLLVIALFPLLAFADDFVWGTIFYAYCQLIALLISAIACLVVLHQNKIAVFKTFRLKIDFQQFKPLIPFAIFAFLVLAHQKIDSVMIQKLASNGDLETGVYAAAYRFLDAATMLPILFASFLYPLLVSWIAQQKDFNVLVNNSMKILGSLSIVISITTWFYKEPLMELFYQYEFNQNLALVFGLLMFTCFFQVVYYVYSSVFTANNNLKILSYISLSGLTINILLNILLIPIYAALGAAISNLCSFGIMTIIYLFAYSKYFQIRFNYLLWFKLFGLVVLMCLAAMLLNYLALYWYFALLILVLIGFVIAFVFKLISYSVVKGFVD